MKKVAIIGSAGVPARYGGFETLAHQLVTNLNEQFELSVYCSQKYYPKADRKATWNNARLFHLPLNANGWQSVFYDCISLVHALFYADILLVLGVSGGIFFPLIKLLSNKKIIVNIDGLEWKRNKWGKWAKRFLKFSESLCVKYADSFITDNKGIQDYTTEAYQKTSSLIEYGADHVLPQKMQAEDFVMYPFLNEQYAFKVCRIEPENNLHIVLEAFAKMAHKTLVIVGNWKHSDYGKNLKEKYKKYTHIYLLDPIYNQQKLDLLRSNCHLYVHGHSAGGTNPSLVEAMYLGLPIIAFDVCYNKATTEEEAFYFTKVADLVSLVQSSDDVKLQENRSRMKSIANRRYTWAVISQKYANVVEEVVFDGKLATKTGM